MQPDQLDDIQGERVARLTAKERECLTRWLTHATAKEIALDLGVSHHAVEKRLKSARQKLGVFTTLDAARLLASVEGYGWTASQSPEVAGGIAIDDRQHARPDDTKTMPVSRRKMVFAGGLIMSLLLLSTLVFGMADLNGGAATGEPRPLPKVIVVDRRTGSATDADAAFAKVFGNLDKDGSGYLEGAELKNGQFRVTRTKLSDTSAPQPQAMGVAAWDTSGDGRVSRDEFVAGMAALSAPRT